MAAQAPGLLRQPGGGRGGAVVLHKAVNTREEEPLVKLRGDAGSRTSGCK